VGEVGERATDDLRALDAAQIGERPVDLDEAAVGRHERHPDRGALERAGLDG